MDMALCKSIRQSRWIFSLTRELNSKQFCVHQKQLNKSSSRFYHQQDDNGNKEEQGSRTKADWRTVLMAGTVATASSFYFSKDLRAKERTETLSEDEIIEREHRYGIPCLFHFHILSS